MVKNETELALKKARKEVDNSPTDGQKAVGNYKKGHINLLGFSITIENPKGSYRKGRDRNGKEWKTLMHNDYGYFVRTLGKDGDAIDVFIGPNLDSNKIFPIDQFINGKFDETKVMLGFDSKEEAKKAYLSNYEKDWKGFKYITEVDIEEFKKWLYDGARQRKPFAKYIRLTEDKERQFNIIQDTNPMLDDYHLGIRSVDNIKTFEEAMAEAHKDYEEYGTYSSYPDTPNSVLERAMETGMITVYSSKPIVNGNFVTTSKMCARDYAGGGHVYSETLPVTDIAWINVEEGQVARENSLNERKNDEGKNVPKKCECGGKVCVQIHGEPVFVCDKCGKYFGTLPFPKNLNEAVKRNPPRDEVAAVSKGNRDADIEAHGKPTAFRTTMTKNKKKYTRKEKHMKPITLTEGQLRQIIKESIEEFYKGSRKERAAYENACDCLYYGYGFKFWFEKNKELLDNDTVVAERIWRQAKDDLGNRDALEESYDFAEDVPYKEVANKVWNGEYIAVERVSQIPEDWKHIANVAEPNGNICGRLFKGKETGKIYFFEMGVI